MSRIPFLALDAYARRLGIEDGEEFMTFKSHIAALDEAFREDWRERNKPPDK